MKTCFLIIHSEAYAKAAGVLRRSLDAYYPLYDQVIIKAETLPKWYPTDMLQNICANRPSQVLKAFAKGFNTVVFLGADQVFYNDKLTNYVEGLPLDNIFFPHMLLPPPHDGLFPKVDTTVNSDMIIWRKNGLTELFIQEYSDYMQKNCRLTEGHFYDQTYLQFALARTRATVVNEPDFNVAFYNLHEPARQFMIEQNTLCNFQFSGFDILNISRHQTRYKPDDIPGLSALMNNYAKELSHVEST